MSTREIRNYVRARAKELKALEGLDEMLTEVGNLERYKVTLEGDLKKGDDRVKAANTAKVRAEEEAKAIIVKAQKDAKSIRESAENVREEAEAIKAGAQEVMDNAIEEAAVTRRKSIEEAEAYANGQKGAIKDLDDAIAKKKGEIKGLVDEAKKQADIRDAILDEISNLKRRFG